MPKGTVEKACFSHYRTVISQLCQWGC